MAKEVEPEEIIKLIDGVYKSIIEKFNPCARQLITAGKAYLKALQGATSASSLFNETLNKIALNAQQGSSSDIGDALINVFNVHKAIQEQHINILKAFYVDLLMPLENNLEKDTKVVQVEQKKFLQQHKANVESYCKAVTTLKKQRKKKNASGTTSKELKSLQAVEEQKNKLKNYCNQSLQNALTQERRRYGFVLERQCSIGKHWMAYHTTGKTLLENNLENWHRIASSRETFNINLNELFSKKNDANKHDMESNSLLLRKTRSMEVAGGSDMKMNDRSFNQNSLPRTKSEHNLTSTNNHEPLEELIIMKAVYTYEAAGKNQLTFEEGDRIALIGGRVNGWQFGENLRTKVMGWFPVTYIEKDNAMNNNINYDQTPKSTLKRNSNSKVEPEPSPTRMFGDTIQFRNTKYFQKISASDLRTSPPPALPPPIPSGTSSNPLNSSQSFSFPKEAHMMEKKRPTIYKQSSKFGGHNEIHNRNNNSVHEPPPQPDIDYSDEEEFLPTRVPLRQHHNNDSDNVKKSSSGYENANSNKNIPNVHNDSNTSTINRKDNFIKRTKSFWKTKKLDEGMNGNAWRHEDIIHDADQKNDYESETQGSGHSGPQQVQQRKKVTENYKRNNDNKTITSMNFEKSQHYSESDSDNSTIKVSERNAFDDESRLGGLKKPVKRREILKQYYNSSDSDTERDTTSDPYDCIVIDDHLVKTKMEFKTFNPPNTRNDTSRGDSSNERSSTSNTGTLLPRTKLNKTPTKSSKENHLNRTTEKNNIDSNFTKQEFEESYPKSYGPWYDLWEQGNHITKS